MKPFGVWHQGDTEDESDFFLGDAVEAECCGHCTNLYTADQLREAQVKVLREAARGCEYEKDANRIRRMADELEKQK